MPLTGLTPDIKRRLLQAKGYSVDEGYDITDEGDIVYAGTPQPSVDDNNVFDTLRASQASSSKPKPSATESFGRAAAEGALPAAAGLAAALGVGAAPFTGGTSLLLSAAAGLVGAGAASYAQRKLVPQGVQEAVFTRPEDVQEHPVATFAGGLAPNAIAFNPAKSLASTGTLLGGLRKVPSALRQSGAAAFTPAEQALLLNAGVNTGVAGGQELVDIAMGGEFSPGRLAANAIAPSLLLSRPTRFGQRIGFHDIPPAQAFEPPQQQAPSPVAQKLMHLLNESPEEVAGRIGPFGGTKQTGIKDFGPEPINTLGQYTQKLDEAAILRYGGESPAEGRVTTPEPATPAAINETKQQDYITALREKAKQDAAAEYEAAKQEAAKGMLVGSDVARAELRPKPRVTTELGREIYPDYTGVTEHDAGVLASEPRVTEAEHVQSDYESGKRRQEESALGGKRADLPVEQYPPAERERLRALEDAEARRRGFGLTRNAPISGLGEVNLRARQVGLSPRAAGDTAGHEVVGHGFVRDLLQSARPKDKQLALDGIREWSGRKDIRSAEEFLALPEAEQAKIEEAFAQQLGIESFNRKKLSLYGTKRDKFVDWWQDVTSRFRETTKESLARDVGSRSVYDAPYGSRPELAPTGKGVAAKVAVGQDESRGQGESGLAPETKPPSGDDVAAYDAVQSRMMQLIKEGKSGSQEFIDAWRENETIKNRHGGMPPKRVVEVEGEVRKQDESALEPAPKENPFDKMREDALGAEEAKKDVGVAAEDKGSEDLRRYRSDSTRRQDESALSEDARTGRRSFANVLTARYDKVAETHKNPTGRYVADQFHKFQSEADRLEGQTGNKLIAATKDYSPEEVARVYEYRHAMDNDAPAPFTLTANEGQLKSRLDAIYKDIGQKVIDSGIRIQLPGGTSRSMKLREGGYQQNTLSNEVAHEWAETGPRSGEYDAAFIKHATSKGVSEADAKDLLQDYKQAIGNAGITPDVKFGAIRKVEGIGLPWSLVEKNFNAAASRYGRRVAADMAFYKYVQSDPKMLKALGLKDQTGKQWRELDAAAKEGSADIEYIGSSDATKQALRSVYGIDLPSNPRMMSAARAVGSMVMQTGTAIRNLMQIPTTIAPYYGVNMSSIGKALAKMKERTGRAFENNAIRSSFKDFDAAGDFEGNPVKFIRWADKFSALMRKYSGRDLSDKLEGLFHYSLGEELATNWFAQAKSGDIKARSMLNRFGTTLEKPAKSYFDTSATVTQDDVARVAKEFVNAARGTYSASGLPSVAMEGNVAPFLALSRWSIERSNIFWRDVVEPLKRDGDWMPLLKTTFSAMLTGAAIEKLNELLSGKRGSDATIKEALADGDADTLAAKAIGLAQLGSLGGIVSDAAKLGVNLAQGKGLSYNNPLSMPAAGMVEDLATRTMQVKQAIEEGEDPFAVLLEYAKDIVVHNSQNARYLHAHGPGKDEAERKQKFRDLRVFEELTDRRSASGDYAAPNPYTGLAAREFKQTDDLARAFEIAPKLIEQAVSNSYDASGALDIERLRKKLRTIKQNSYQTLPATLTSPRAFSDFINHIRETQGEEQAQSRVADFFRQNAINKVKSRAIPQL